MAILEDLVFRCLWTLNISVGETDILPHREILTTVLAMLEVFRCVQYSVCCEFLLLLLSDVLYGTFFVWRPST